MLVDVEDSQSLQRRGSLDTAFQSPFQSCFQRPRAFSHSSALEPFHQVSLHSLSVNNSAAAAAAPTGVNSLSLSAHNLIGRSGSGHGPRIHATHHQASPAFRASPSSFQQTESMEESTLRNSFDPVRAQRKRISQKRMLVPSASLPSLHLHRGQRTSVAAASAAAVNTTGASPPVAKQKSGPSPREHLSQSYSEEEDTPSPTSITPGSSRSGSAIGSSSSGQFQFTPPQSIGILPRVQSSPRALGSAPAPIHTPPLSFLLPAAAADSIIDTMDEYRMRRIIDAMARVLQEGRQSAEHLRDVEWSDEVDM